ncbi:hypothetical protein M8C21_027924, partial [Ambrosia artemisiifolia]
AAYNSEQLKCHFQFILLPFWLNDSRDVVSLSPGFIVIFCKEVQMVLGFGAFLRLNGVDPGKGDG